MLSRARIEGRPRPPRVVNPYIRAPAPTCTYDGRTSRPIPTSPPVSVRTDRGSDRPCAGLRWPRTANPASRQSLHLPSALYDAHPSVADSEDIRTVIDIRGREPACERCRRDDGTARRSTASVACTGADDDPSSRRRPFRSPSRSHVSAPSAAVVPRSATALRANVRGRTFAPLGLLLLQKAV